MKTPDPQTPEVSEDPKSSPLAVIGVISAVLLIVIIVWLQAIFYRYEDAELRRKLYDQVPEELARLRAEQQEALYSYRWIDEKRGVVSIPIDRAMDLIAEESGRSDGGNDQ